MHTLGINLHAIEGLSDDAFLREIASLGFSSTFFEVTEPTRQASIADSCAKHGIVCETLHAPFSHINDIWREDDCGMLDELLHAIDHCVIAGAGIAVVHLSSGQNPPPMCDSGFDRIRRLVDYAASKNVKIAFENTRLLANIAWAMETFPREVVGFCWDVGHESCFTPGRHYMPLFGDRLLCTHIHDNTGEYNLDKHWIPFDGCIDYTRVADSLRTSGYRGSLMLELGNPSPNGSGGKYNGITPEDYLRRAYTAAATLRSMVEND